MSLIHSSKLHIFVGDYFCGHNRSSHEMFIYHKHVFLAKAAKYIYFFSGINPSIFTKRDSSDLEFGWEVSKV